MVVVICPHHRIQGAEIYPARDAGVEIGDLIIEVNGQPVKTELELAEAIDRQGQKRLKSSLLINGDEQQMNIDVKTGYCQGNAKVPGGAVRA